MSLKIHCRRFSSNPLKIHDAYNFFKQSILPTDHFQESLPRLPIPPLDKTCQRYLAAIHPILNNDEKAFETTRQIVADFRMTDGKRLDAQLRHINASNRHTSYISKPWFDMYLKSRLPLILNFNYFLSFAEDQHQLPAGARLTNYLISSIRFMNSLRANWLDPEIYHLNPKKTDNDHFRQTLRILPKKFSFYGAFLKKAFPLDMSQYDRLFNSTRIPKLICDELVTNSDDVRHIIVVKRGHYYKVDILDEHGHLLSAETIAAMIKYLSEDLNEEENQFPLGYFTADRRDRWATIRTKLESLSEYNRRCFQLIDRSILLVCLDEDDPKQLNKSMKKQQRAEYVAGKYLCHHASNRWYDKSFNMILLSDGTLGLHCEHSWGDGVALLRFCNDIDQDANEHRYIDSTKYSSISSSNENRIEKLLFQFDDHLKSELEISKKNYNEFVSKFHVNAFQESILGKNLLKTVGLTPDAMMQLAIQMSYYKLHQRFVATYESCSTAAFKHGRTETIRPVTKETKEFIETFSQTNVDRQRKKSLLKKCSDKHQKLIKEAATGHGFDRHLFALKYLQEIENKEEKLHRIFTDSSYQLLNHIILSTSTVSSKHIAAGGFGPVAINGYGIGYLIDEEQCGLLVTSFMGRELPSFMEAAFESFRDLVGLIQDEKL